MILEIESGPFATGPVRVNIKIQIHGHADLSVKHSYTGRQSTTCPNRGWSEIVTLPGRSRRFDAAGRPAKRTAPCETDRCGYFSAGLDYREMEPGDRFQSRPGNTGDRGRKLNAWTPGSWDTNPGWAADDKNPYSAAISGDFRQDWRRRVCGWGLGNVNLVTNPVTNSNPAGVKIVLAQKTGRRTGKPRWFSATTGGDFPLNRAARGPEWDFL